MGNFINNSSFRKMFFFGQELNILNVGYDDFYTVSPSKTFRTQSFYTWHFVLSGSGTLEIHGKTHEIQSGEMFFIPPNTKMRYYPCKEAPWEYVWFSFGDDKILHYCEQMGFSFQNPVCRNPNAKRIHRVLQRLFDALIYEDCGYFRVLSAFYEILDICTMHFIPTEMQEVKRLLDENFTMPSFSIQQLCRDVGISHPHLLRLFKKAYHTTLVRYLIKKRVDLACELLSKTDMSVASVAHSCGFSDELHFFKTFKRHMGCSALHYRRSLDQSIPDSIKKAR